MSIEKTLTISEQDESIGNEAGNFSKIVVSYTDEENFKHKVSFVGRWLWQDYSEGNQTYSVALTEKERLFVLIESPDGDHHIIFDTFNEMCTDQFSDDLLVRIANLIGEEYEEALDI